MGHVNTIFHQILQFIPKGRVNMLADKYGADRYVKSFDTWSHMASMIFAQAAGKDSLRDLEAAFNAHASTHYHIGACAVSRSTLSDANSRRPWEMFQELYSILLSRFEQFRPNHSFKFKNPLFSIDSSIIDLCLASFQWATFRARKGAVKLHCRLDHAGLIPDVIVITDGKKHDIKSAEELTSDLKPDSIVSMDRAYIDFKFLYSLDLRGVFFVSRAKKNIDYTVTGQQQLPKNKNLISDQTIVLNGVKSKERYPKELRLVKILDPKKNKTLTFITNNFKLAASTIAEIYKARWQIELFFKWIKQNLKIKTFMGTSKNAVMTQIWTAIIYFLILHYIKAQTRYDKSLHILSEIIKVSIFHRLQILDLLFMDKKYINKLKHPPPTSHMQLSLPIKV